MKINKYTFLLITALFLSISSCTTDFFEFSKDIDENKSSLKAIYPMVYCNKFNENGFRGIIVAYYDWDKNNFNTNRARLYLWDVPYEFVHPQTNYIQFHAFSITHNRADFHKFPLSVEMIKDSISINSSIITTISHELLEEMGEITIKDLIGENSFVLRDVEGWHGIHLSVFDTKNKPIKTARVLIPPFEANPQTYFNNNNKERLLLPLHPFEKIHDNTDKVFHEKGLDICKLAPIDFEIPPFKKQDIVTKEESSSIDQLLEDLSLL